jgi:hypothetical protein
MMADPPTSHLYIALLPAEKVQVSCQNCINKNVKIVF